MGAKVRAIRRRMRSVTSTRKITKAMELIAASRIVKAQARALRSRPYSSALTDMIEMLAGEAESPLLAEREQITNTGIIVVTSDRGLCGAYNANVLREADRARRREAEAGRGVVTTAVGHKAQTYFKFRRIPMAGEFVGVSDRPSYEDAQRIAQDSIARYVNGEVDLLLLAYTDFVSTFLQRARVAQILPVKVPEQERPQGPQAMFDYEPEPAALLEALLPRYVEMRVYAAMLESAASEHAARRRAMKAATDNADDLLKILERVGNQARQAEITAEIADIVGGAEALRK